jgi:hypothetical protein
LGLKRGSIVRHPKHGVTLVGGLRKAESACIAWKTASGYARTRSRRICRFWLIRPRGHGSSPCLKAGVSAATNSDEYGQIILVPVADGLVATSSLILR